MVPEVEFAVVEQRDVPLTREWVGTLQADVNATISAQVSGYLTNRAYSEGVEVTNGQVLFQIDSASFQTALANAQAQLAQAEALKSKTKLDVDRYTPLASTDASLCSLSPACCGRRPAGTRPNRLDQWSGETARSICAKPWRSGRGISDTLRQKRCASW